MAACNAWRMLQRAGMAHAAACKQMSHTCAAAACQSTSGLLVAPTSSTLLAALLGSQPSICTSISVFSRRLASCSPVTPHTHCSLVQPKIFASFRSLASAACLPASCQLQEGMLLAATNHHAACTGAHCWLADSFVDMPFQELSKLACMESRAGMRKHCSYV